jgi:hypothetical protein
MANGAAARDAAAHRTAAARAGMHRPVRPVLHACSSLCQRRDTLGVEATMPGGDTPPAPAPEPALAPPRGPGTPPPQRPTAAATQADEEGIPIPTPTSPSSRQEQRASNLFNQDQNLAETASKPASEAVKAEAEEQVKKDFMYFVKIAEKVRVVAALPTSAFGHEFVVTG